MFNQLIPLTQNTDRNLPAIQREFVEAMATSYADQQLMKLVSQIPPRVRVAITLGILVAPWCVQAVQSLRSKGK